MSHPPKQIIRYKQDLPISLMGRSLNYNYTWIDNVVRKPYWTPIVPRTLTSASTTDICDKAKKTQLRAHIDKIALYPQIPSYTSCILSLGKRNTPEMNCKQPFFTPGILFPKLFWQYARKKYTSHREKLLIIKIESRKLANIWDQ